MALLLKAKMSSLRNNCACHHGVNNHTVGTFEKDNHRLKFCFSISISLLSPITDPNPDFWSIQYGQCIHMNQWPPKEIWANYGFTRKLELSVSSLHILLQLETDNNVFVTWWNPCFIPYTSLLFTFSKGIGVLIKKATSDPAVCWSSPHELVTHTFFPTSSSGASDR